MNTMMVMSSLWFFPWPYWTSSPASFSITTQIADCIDEDHTNTTIGTLINLLSVRVFGDTLSISSYEVSLIASIRILAGLSTSVSC